MDKPSRFKGKNKKPATKSKSCKKKKSDGPMPTCSMFLAELTRKLASKRKQEEENPKGIVDTIIDSITNALPFKISRRSPSKKESTINIEKLQTFAPELLPNNTLSIKPPPIINDRDNDIEEIDSSQKFGFKMPKMPLANSEAIKIAVEKRKRAMTHDASINTGTDHDVASELAKHVNTLRKISLIAEEFNQKTAKNLKEIVDSVQEDLVKKLEELQSEQQASKCIKISINDQADLKQ